MNSLALLLRPVSWLYGAAVWVRGKCYDLGVFRVDRVSVPVISVGNMSAGGTGKTPLVEYLVRMLLAERLRVAVVSRGYRRTTSGSFLVSDGTTLSVTAGEAGDEPYQIARKFPRAVVIVDERRARAAAVAVRDHAAQVIILDDGFQHRALGRDLDIVAVDSTKPLRTMPLLPSGLRRDVMRSLERAGVLVYSRCADPAHAHEELGEAASAAECCVRADARRCVSIAGTGEIPLSALPGSTAVAFCAIGDPLSFRRSIEDAGCTVLDFQTYPDHHEFADADLEMVRVSADERRPDHVLTTEKDAMRLIGRTGLAALLPRTTSYLEIECRMLRGEERFRERVLGVARRSAA